MTDAKTLYRDRFGLAWGDLLFGYRSGFVASADIEAYATDYVVARDAPGPAALELALATQIPREAIIEALFALKSDGDDWWRLPHQKWQWAVLTALGSPVEGTAARKAIADLGYPQNLKRALQDGAPIDAIIGEYLNLLEEKLTLGAM